VKSENRETWLFILAALTALLIILAGCASALLLLLRHLGGD